jgi:hypothetical protein
MATIKRHILAQNDLMRKHGIEIVEKEYVEKTVSRQSSILKQEINLGIHEKHIWQPVLGNFGPHQGKIICNTCDGKFVTWLSKQHIRLICQ